jgi:hypothetical protein
MGREVFRKSYQPTQLPPNVLIGGNKKMEGEESKDELFNLY